jgi:hypothetical protein
MAKDEKNVVTDEVYKQTVFEEGGNLVIDLENIAEAKFEVIPKGIYSAEIDSVEFGLSNNSGAPMFTLQLLITEGDFQGRKLFTYLSFGQKALPYTKATISKIAPELLVGPFKPQEIADEGQLLGKPCRIRVAVEDYNGEPRSRVGQILAATTGDSIAASSGAKGKGFF